MRILITGAHGQLGHDVAATARKRGFVISALSRAELDIVKAEAVSRAMAGFEPDLLVNCAAYTAVDRAEDEPELAL
nr:sugar nucleotide-binding protein [Desulfobacterales bacterium]